VTLTGRIQANCPIARGRITGGIFHIGRTGPLELVIDTGFSGAIALPHPLLKRLALQFIATDSFTLATGEVIDLPAYAGMVQIGPRRIRTWFIPGDHLIGIDSLRSAFSRMTLDFDRDLVTLV